MSYTEIELFKFFFFFFFPWSDQYFIVQLYFSVSQIPSWLHLPISVLFYTQTGSLFQLLNLIHATVKSTWHHTDLLSVYILTYLPI